jgi:hypothetical protein
MTCDYCRGTAVDGKGACAGCGAPRTAQVFTGFDPYAAQRIPSDRLEEELAWLNSHLPCTVLELNGISATRADLQQWEITVRREQ